MRIFRVHIHAGHEAEFEGKFREVSVPLVKAQQGLVSVSIGRPVASSPEEFVMVTTWHDEAALRKFVGDNYTKAVIPPGMEQHMVECWVHHYELM